MTTTSATYHITAQDVDTLLEVELASHDPAAPARLFTEVYLTASHLADVPPSARSLRRPLLSATPALWSSGGACLVVPCRRA